MEQPLRVLQVGKYYPPCKGGMEVHLQGLCLRLARERNVHVEVVVSNTTCRSVREVQDGIPVTRCLEVAQLSSTSVCPTMPAELSRRDYDLIHIHFPNPMAVFSYLASRKPRRHSLVVTYHSDIVRQWVALQAFRPFMHAVLRRADAIIVTSERYMSSSPDLAAYRRKCVCIPLGIDASRFDRDVQSDARAAELRARYGAPLLLGVGRLIYYKGFAHAIEAMRFVPGTLLLVGDGPLRTALERGARRAGVAERVHFLGEVDDSTLRALYRASDLFLLPSIARSEAFGIVQLEAMASQVPVVNTFIDSGVPYVSRHGETGTTVRPGDPLALAKAIRELLDRPDLRHQYGRAGRVRASTEFSSEQVGVRTLELYRRLRGLSIAGARVHG